METGNHTPSEVTEKIIAVGAPTERRIRRYERAGRAGLVTAVGGGLVVGGEYIASVDPKVIYVTLVAAAVGAATAGLGVVADRMRMKYFRSLSRQIGNISKGGSGEQNLPPFDPHPDLGGAPVPLNP